MSGSNDLTQILSVRLSDTHDLLDVNSEAGTYSREIENGVTVAITIEKGKIATIVAKDRDGNSLKHFYLQMNPGEPGGETERVCYVCYYPDSPYGYYGDEPLCTKIPCGMM